MDSAIRRPTSSRLAPAADMAFSVQTMADSFFMSNMSPQKPAFNRGEADRNGNKRLGFEDQRVDFRQHRQTP